MGGADRIHIGRKELGARLGVILKRDIGEAGCVIPLPDGRARQSLPDPIRVGP
jgi:hypothetical protein